METKINTQSDSTKEIAQVNPSLQTNAQTPQKEEKKAQTPSVETPLNAMEKERVERDEITAKAVSGVFLSTADAEEFSVYKKQKILSAVSFAVSRTQGSLLNGEDVQRVCERANRLRQVAVKTPLTKIMQAKYYLGASNVKIDCEIGGTGETLTKVKVYEAQLAVKKKAKEITLVATPSVLDTCRYGELRKEIKRVKRAIKRTVLKVKIPKQISPSALTRVARVCSDTGVNFLSVPYFSGCERLRLDLTGGCELEVVGVENFADYRRLIGAGVRRIVTDHAWEFYSEWLKECGEYSYLKDRNGNVLPPNTGNRQGSNGIERERNGQKAVHHSLAGEETAENSSETEYKCRLEGTQLKFL